MVHERINVTRSSMPGFDEYMEKLKTVWDSRWLSNRGGASVEFEEKLKQYLETDNLYLFANGHLALEVALNALHMKGEVITTPFTHCSTIHAIVRNGLKPVFVDIRESDCTINPEYIEAAITENTAAIVATHVYGFICDVEAIEKIGHKYGLKVIYDAAHAFGVTYKGIGSANFGDASMFSTHATKVFHTIEGGIVAYKDRELFKELRHLVNFGFTSQDDIEYVGTNARMNEFEAVMGICNLEYIDGEIAKRKMVWDRYVDRLSGIKGLRLIIPNSNLKWNYSYFPVFFDGYKETRDEIRLKLEKENIFARKYFYPIVNKAGCYNEDYGTADVPVAAHASECVLTLPMYAELTLQDVDYICDIIIR